MPAVSTLLALANVQMAAEALFGHGDDSPGQNFSVGLSGSEGLKFLTDGNLRSSRFTPTQADEFARIWQVVEHTNNSRTGFSGTLFRVTEQAPQDLLLRYGLAPNQLVLSFRSTEFADDSARDSLATNAVEVKERGWAFGQIADMEAWYTHLRDVYSTDFARAGGKFTVTGYSLGGHLATAFGVLRREDGTLSSRVDGIYTFNGAGVGKVRSGTLLSDVIGNFRSRRAFGSNADLFPTGVVRDVYQEISGVFHAGSSVSSADVSAAKARVSALTATSGTYELAQIKLLSDALARIGRVVSEVERITGVVRSGRRGVPDAKVVPTENVEAISLDYQLAVGQASLRTFSTRTVFALDFPPLAAYANRAIAPDAIDSVYDVYGDSSPSGVANSQIHYGHATPVLIEDQPLFRGNVTSQVMTVAMSSVLVMSDARLLDNDFVHNDFGDSHSLVLLVDSLSAQQALLDLDPSCTQHISSIFQAASFVGRDTWPGTQGVAEGDILENLLSSLANTLGLSIQPMNGKTEGGTWADVNDRTILHANISTIRGDAAFKAIQGKVLVRPAGLDLGAAARENFGAAVALQTLSPFWVTGKDAEGDAVLMGAWQVAWGLQYDKWDLDKASPDPQEFTDQWIADRSQLLEVKLGGNRKNTANSVLNADFLPIDRRVDFRFFELGKTEATELQALNPAPNGPGGPTTRPHQLISFGGDADDTLQGTESIVLGDHLYGAGGNDVLNGLDGDDWIEGNSENDSLSGGGGSDTLMGGSGADTLDGGKGLDDLRGGADFDTYVVKAGEGSDVIVDKGGKGEIKVADSAGAEFTLGQSPFVKQGANRWTSKEGGFTFTTRLESDGSTTLNVSGSGVSLSVKKFNSGDLGIALPGTEPTLTPPSTGRTIIGDLKPVEPLQFDDLGNVVVTSVVEVGRADTLYDSAGADFIQGLDGDDDITLMRGGDDFVQAGGGTDLVEGGAGKDLIEGGFGRDAIVGGGADDELWGFWRTQWNNILEQTEAGPASEGDFVSAGSGNDTIGGHSSADALFGGDGRDSILGGAGDDNIAGDAEARWVYQHGWQVDREVITDPQGQRFWRLNFTRAWSESGAAQGNDLIFAGAGQDWVFAQGGDDWVDAGEGNDFAVGGVGADALLGGDGNDEMMGDGDLGMPEAFSHAPASGHGNDTLDGGAGNDSLYGGGRDDELYGGADADYLVGDALDIDASLDGTDLLDGGAGNDEMAGYGGNDKLLGGDGADRMDGDLQTLAGERHGRDSLEGGEGRDTMIGNGGDDSLDGGTGNDLMYGDAAGLAVSFHGSDTLKGGDGNDTLIGFSKNDWLEGGAGDDQLLGDEASLAETDQNDDFADGGDDNDLVRGFGGNDVLLGGAGNDTLVGDGGNDTLVGGVGQDALDGGAGDDTYVFASGDSASASPELIDDAQGNNRIQLSDGFEMLSIDLTPTAGSQNVIRTATDAIYIQGGLMSSSIRTVEVGGVTYSAADFFGKTFNQPITQTATEPNSSIQGGKKNDTLTITAGYSIVAGGAGDDEVVVNGGGNAIRYLAGDGTDTITDGHVGAASGTLQFGEGITPESIRLSHANGQLVLSFNDGRAGGIRVNGFDQSSAETGPAFSQFTFANGTSLTYAQLIERGFDIEGSAVAEPVQGTNLADRLRGSSGDTLVGGEGSDIYQYESEDGAIILADGDATQGVADKLQLGAYISPYEIEATRSYNNLVLIIGSVASGDRVTLQGYFDAGDDSVETIEFEDGTVWTSTDVQLLLQRGTTGNDLIVGTAGNDVIFGAAGNDTLHGLAGNDTLDGDVGADRLEGGPGDDTYQFDVGDGGATIVETDGLDVIRFGQGISPADIVVDDSGSDLILRVGTSNDTLRLQGVLAVGADALQVESVEFESGTNWSLTEVLDRRRMGTSDSDSLIGFAIDDTMDGAAGNDTISGRAGADYLRGGAGDDTLYGQAGNDVYVVDAAEGSDVISETNGGLSGDSDKLLLTGGLVRGDFTFNRTGTDFVGTSAVKGVTFRIANQFGTSSNDNGVETIEFSDGQTLDRVGISQLASVPTNGGDTLTGSNGDDVIDGLDGNDTIYGLAGNDILDGGPGVDSLLGGPGDDLYRVDDETDSVVEQPNEGGDTVISWVNYTLSPEVENLTLTDWANTGTGNGLNNLIIGTDGANTLMGAAGDDTLDGGPSVDRLVGGPGDDRYIVDSLSDVIVENANEGLDTIVTPFSHTLAAGSTIENLEIAGSATTATGNAGANRLTGNALDNMLTGGDGDDTMVGGGGNDTYFVAQGADVVQELVGQGTDLVSSSVTYSLSPNVENLTLTGTAAINATGNADSNVLTGNSAVNVLTGGAGDDTYYVTAGDSVVEKVGEGTDFVFSAVTFTLAENVENLTLTGTAKISGTGNGSANVLTGNSANNALSGGAGNDLLLGGGGTDTLTGGDGDDYFVIDDSKDTVTETATGGIDTIEASFNYTLSATGNVENLVITASATTATGNASPNVLTGNALANTLTGGAGYDTMIGGAGDDSYLVADVGDVIQEQVNGGKDLVSSTVTYTLSDHVENLTLTGTANINATGNAGANVLTGNSGVNVLTGGAGDDTYGVTAGDSIVESAGEGSDTVLSGTTYSLVGMDNVENLTLTGTGNINATGNASANILTGNSGTNVLTGGAGDDIYFIGAGDSVVEVAGGGIDTVNSSATYTLPAEAENLTLTGSGVINGTGNGLANILIGNSSANALSGMGGDDTYVVSAGDTVIENAGGGTDTVYSSADFLLGSNVEGLVLTGTSNVNATGNTDNNRLTGNAGNNRLDGKGGADTMEGGLGNDVYVLDSGLDVVIENAGEGSDTVETNFSFTSAGEIENITLTGTGNIDAIGDSVSNLLTGNSGANLLSGNGGNDTLVGGGGNDTLAGGAGNDTYVFAGAVSAASMVENPGEGADTVQTSATYTLAAEFENLKLTGSAAANGTGNAAANLIEGNDGANDLDGLGGADTLLGGLGNDTLRGGAGDILRGGAGDDTYILTGGGTADEDVAGSGGIDTVISDQNISLGGYANVVMPIENATLVGTANATISGHAGKNVLTGNSGSNRISDYFGGGDTLDGGAGNDTIIGAQGSTLIGGLGNDSLILDDPGTNTLLQGGQGDDFYDLYYGSGTVAENAGEGFDTISTGTGSGSLPTYTLAANVEKLISDIASVTGNASDNTFVGRSTNISGLGGNDTFEASNVTAQTLNGGAGNDTFKIGAGDVVNENANEGADTVISSVTYTLPVNVENLTLTDTATNGTGNASDNVIAGNAGANSLDGLAGRDILAGLGGNDTLTNASGTGAMDGGAAIDTLTGSTAAEFLAGGAGNDSIQLGGGADIVAFNFGDGSDTVITATVAGDAGDTLSIGKFDISSLRLNKEGSDLLIKVNATTDALRLKDWYLSVDHHSVKTLQWMVDSSAGSYTPGSGDTLRNNRVKTFNFESVVAQFDAALAATPTLTNWAPPTTVYQSALLSSSDTTAVGGALSSQYAKDGTLQSLDRDVGMGLLGDAGFGTTAQSTSNGAGGSQLFSAAAGSTTSQAMLKRQAIPAGEGDALSSPDRQEGLVTSASDATTVGGAALETLSTSAPTGSGLLVPRPSPSAPTDYMANLSPSFSAYSSSPNAAPARTSDLWQDVDAWLRLQGALEGTDSGALYGGDLGLGTTVLMNGGDARGSAILSPSIYRIEQVASMNEVIALR